MVDVGAAAVVADAVAVGPAVGDVQPPSAVAAAQQAGEKRVAAAHGAAHHQAPAVGVVGDQALVPLELRPGKVAFVVIHDQHVPFLAVAAMAAADPLAPVLDGDAARRPAEGVGAAVDRVGQEAVNGVVDRQLPDDPPTRPRPSRRRQQHLLLAQPEMHLADALELRELPEHQPDRLAHALVGILGDPVVPDLHIAHGDAEEELAAARLLAQRLERALAQDRQLHLAHRALHAEQQAVVRQARIVDAVLVGQADSPRARRTRAACASRARCARAATPPPPARCRRAPRRSPAAAARSQGGRRRRRSGRGRRRSPPAPPSRAGAPDPRAPYCRRRLSWLCSSWSCVDCRT